MLSDSSRKDKQAVAGMFIHPCKAYPFIIFLLILLLIPSAVSAGNFTNTDAIMSGLISDTYLAEGTDIHYDLSDQGYAVTAIQLSIYHRPSETEFTLNMLDGSTHQGSITYSNLSLMSCDITLDLDSYSKHWTYYSPGGIDLLNTYIGTYATNADTGELGILLAEEWISYTDINNYVFSPDPQISVYPIKSVDISASERVSALITYAEIGTVQTSITTDNKSIFEWFGKLFDFVSSVSDIIFSTMAVFKFIVIDHWFSLIVLYESVTMAYAASQSRDIFSFSRKVFRYNKALFEAIIGFIAIIIQIFHRLIDALKFW